MGQCTRDPRILFIQATEAGAYPPIVNAAVLMAECGWRVTVLTAPIAGNSLAFAKHPRIDVCAIPERSTHVMSKFNYLRYIGRAVWLARSIRPDVVYASDQLGGAAGLVVAKAVGARLIYHEHDSPGPGAAVSGLRRMRTAAARNADIVIFPNEERAQLALTEIGFTSDRLHVIWNMPRKSELPPMINTPDDPMIVYYHGSISPARLPQAAIEAIRRFSASVRLYIAGYEAPGSPGYLDSLRRQMTAGNGQPLMLFLGLLPLHSQLLAAAAQAHVGLALMPPSNDDINMRYMTGASNKIFDYMAAGLATLVSDLPDWRHRFVAPGFARACNPESVESIAGQLAWFRDNPAVRREMGERNRAKIQADWNYDTGFAPVIERLRSWIIS
jgi:glycosyltransferase involved in cell wall biosynthesis